MKYTSVVKKLEKFIQKHEVLFLIGILLIGFIIRLVYSWTRGAYAVWEGDEGFFGQIAGNLLAGKGFVANGRFYSTRMPLLTLVATGYSFLVGHSVVKLHVLSALIGSVIPLTTYLLAKRLTGSLFTAGVAAVYAMCYPFFIHEASMLDTENLFIPLFLIYWWYLLDVLEHKKYSAVKAGLFLGLCFLTRPTLSIFLFFFGLLLLWRKWSLRDIFANIVVQGLIALAVLSPWSIFISLQHNQLLLFSSGTNQAMIGGTNPVVIRDQRAAGEWICLDRDFPEVLSELESKAGPEETAKVLYVVRTYWRDMPLLMWNKTRKLWGFSPKYYLNRNLRDDIVGLVSYGWMLPFLLIILFQRKQPDLDLFVVMALYYTFMTLVTSGTMRFRLPLDSVIIIYVVNYLRQKMGIKIR